MAKLERPKGYSRKLWKKLQNQIRNIKRFVREKTKTGVDVKNIPDTKNVYTAEGRKNIRDWSAKKQWEQSEYVNRETGEVLTGAEARRQWSRDKSREKEAREKPQNAPDYNIYEQILDRLQTIPNERVFIYKGVKTYKDTGGIRDNLIDLLNDIADETEYLMEKESQIAANIEIIRFASQQMTVEFSISELFIIFNKGALGKTQWEKMQNVDVWNGESYDGEYDDMY